jgi:hypothetical protein
VIDSYLLKITCVLSLSTYVVNERVNKISLTYIIIADIVILLLTWILQKKTKLSFYENYVQKRSVKNYKDYFHKTLSQPLVVVKLK